MKHYEDCTEKIEDLSDKHQKIVSEEIGKTYNHLTIESFACRNRTALYFNCTCVCGTQRVVKFQNLKSGHQKSCGCRMREVASKTVKTARANQEYPDGTSINGIKSALRGVVSSASKTIVSGVTEVQSGQEIPSSRHKGSCGEEE